MPSRRPSSLPRLRRRSLLAGIGAIGGLYACGGSGEAREVSTPPRPIDVSPEPTSNGAPVSIPIGLFAPLSGPMATFGQGVKDGCALALEASGSSGAMKLIVEDSAGSPDGAAAAVERLLGAGARVLIGDVTSSASKVAGAIAQRAETPMISPAASEATVTRTGDCIFRSCLTDPAQGRMAAAFIAAHHKARVGLLRRKDDPYCDALADAFVAATRDLGLSVVETVSFPRDVTGFREHLKRLAAAGSEIVYAPLFSDVMHAVAADARALGMPGELFVGGDAYGERSFLQSLPGAHFTDHFAADSTEFETTSFVEAFRRRHGGPPDALAAAGFDAMVFVLDAVGRSRGTSKRAIRDALASCRDLRGATGPMSMGPARDAVKPGVILQLTNGAARFVRRIGL